MLLVLVLGVGASFAADTNQTGLQASDDTDTVVSISGTNTVSSNDNDSSLSSDINILNTTTVGSNTDLVVNDANKQNKLLSSTNGEMLSDSIYNWEDLANQINTDGNLKGNYYQYNSTDSGIPINITNKVIDGQGATIDGNAQQYPFVSSGNLTLKNINFLNILSTNTHNAATHEGGVILFSLNSSNIIIENCNFTNIKRTLNGAGVLGIPGGRNVTIKNCNFRDSSSYNSLILFYSSDANYINNNITIKDCTFNNINASNNGLFYFTKSSNVKMDNIKVNNVNYPAGSIIYFSNTVDTNITNCDFKDTVGTWAVMRFANGDGVNVKNCNFDKTQRTDVNSKRGIGILIQNGQNFLIDNCNITNIPQCGGYGGGITIGAGDFICKNITINHCNFINITTGSSGTGIYTGGHNGGINEVSYLNIYNCKFDSGHMMSTSRGSAIELNAHHTSIVNCTFSNNYAGGSGALGLYSTASYCLIDNCTFVNNSARQGGAISAEQAGCNNAQIINCRFINNTARSGNGGALTFYAQNSTIADCTFIGNNASGNGGAVAFSAQNGNIADCNFINNSATNGGAVFANAKNAAVDNCKFENNNATDGSNFYATAGNPITITNCGFDLFYVSDDGDGDGLRIGAPTNFVDAVQAIENGGRIVLIGTFTSLLDKNVGKPVIIEAYNDDVVVDLLGANSRAMTIAGDNITIKGITFKNSLITGNGGVILWNGANGKVESCTFDNNTAANGGAIYWAGANGNVTSSTFTKNTATANGGAIYWAGDNGAIESSTFTNNNAIYGSAVFLKTGVSTFELKNSQFTSNVASTSGTVAAEKLTTFSLGGNTFTSNTVGSGDTDYYFYDNTPVITSSLVYVSPSGSATSNGLTESTPTTLDHAIDNIIEDGGQIVFLDGNYNFERTLNNLNLTFVGRTGAVITGSRTSRVFTVTGSSNIVFDSLTFSSLSFDSTSADSVISASSSNVDIKNSEFKTITGTNLASIITYDASSTGNIVDSTFTSNTATNLVNINGNVNITGSTFTSNSGRTSTVSYNSGSKGTISGTTFSSNSGTYRNLYVNSNNVAVTGNTFDTTASLNSVSTVIYPNNVALSGTFNTGSNYAFSGISAKNGNTVIGTGSVSSNTYSATWTKPLPGTCTVTLANTDNKGNTFNYASTPNVSVPVRLTTVYIGPSATGAKTGIDTNNLATWNDVAGILTTDGTVVFTAGTYSNFYGKTVSNSWKLTGSGSVTLDAGNNGRIFTISANNVQISGLTFKNGKAADSYGSAIHWTGTGGSITNSVLTANTGRPITATNTVSISNSQLKDQISLTKSNIDWGDTETITGTFAHSAPSKVTILFDGVSQGEYTVSSSKVTASYAYTNTATRSVGSYVVTDPKNIYKEVL